MHKTNAFEITRPHAIVDTRSGKGRVCVALLRIKQQDLGYVVPSGVKVVRIPEQSAKQIAGTFYVVRRGRVPGIYETWDECRRQINKYSGAFYRKFSTRDAAEKFYNLSDTRAKKVNRKIFREKRKNEAGYRRQQAERILAGDTKGMRFVPRKVHRLVVRIALNAFWRGLHNKRGRQLRLDMLRHYAQRDPLAGLPIRRGIGLPEMRKTYNQLKIGKAYQLPRVCFVCGAPANHRHHVIPLSLNGVNQVRNLVALCQPCHSHVHGFQV